MNKHEAQNIKFELELLKLVESRLTQKCAINRRLGDYPDFHKGIANLNLTRFRLETAYQLAFGRPIPKPKGDSSSGHENEVFGLEHSSNHR